MIGEKLTVATSRRLTSIRLAVALTVSLTLCDADELGASRSCLSSACAYLSSFQMERPAQKAPRDLSFWRLTEDAGMSRTLASSGSRVVDDELGFRYTLGASRPWLQLLGSQINAFESPRAPPREGPVPFS